MPFKTDPDWLQTTEIVRGSNQTPAQSDGESNRLPSQLLDNTLDNRSRISALEGNVTTIQGDYATQSQLNSLLAQISSLNTSLPTLSGSSALRPIEFNPDFPNNNRVNLTSITNGQSINLGKPQSPAVSYPDFWKLGDPVLNETIPEESPGIFGKFTIEATKGAGVVEIIFYVGPSVSTITTTPIVFNMGSLTSSTTSSGEISGANSFFYPRNPSDDLFIYFEAPNLPSSYEINFQLTGYLG